MSGRSRLRSPWWIAVVAGMASFLDAGAIVATGTALVLYQDDFGLDGGEIARLSALLTLMIAAGALVGGRLGDRFGRRRVFTVTMVLFVLGAAALTFAPGVGSLYLGLILVGLAAGADLPVSIAMISESAPEHERGRMVSFTHVLWIAGILAPSAMGIVVGGMGSTGARLLYGMLLAVSVIVLVLRAGLPESTMWQSAHDAAAAPGAEVPEVGIKDLLRSRYLVPLVALGLFFAIGNITANTLGQFTTYLWVNVAGSTVQLASTISLVSYAFNLVAMFFVVRYMDTRYRMLVFAVGGVITVAAYLVPALGGVVVPTLIALAFLSALGGPMAGEPIFKVWSQELFPTLYRSTAQGIMIAFTRVIAAGMALVTPALIAVGPQMLFVILVGTTMVALSIGMFWVRRLPRAVDDQTPSTQGTAVDTVTVAR
jgi:inositol transporter-like SP family MFS transporter